MSHVGSGRVLCRAMRNTYQQGKLTSPLSQWQLPRCYSRTILQGKNHRCSYSTQKSRPVGANASPTKSAFSVQKDVPKSTDPSMIPPRTIWGCIANWLRSIQMEPGQSASRKDGVSENQQPLHNTSTPKKSLLHDAIRANPYLGVTIDLLDHFDGLIVQGRPTTGPQCSVGLYKMGTGNINRRTAMRMRKCEFS